MLLLTLFIILFYVSGFSSQAIDKNLIDKHDHPLRKKIECGVGRVSGDNITEGIAYIEEFPWLGLLIYPIDNSYPTTTTVILITSKFALSSALDIDFYPKKDFRARSRVILGNNCSGPYIRIRDYTFYPDFTHSTFSSLAIVQLDTSTLKMKLFPICAPPEEFSDGDKIFALNLVHDCYNSSMVMVYKMEYTDTTQCRDYYRRVELDMETMWPTHLVCAQGTTGGHCIWRSGTALVIRDKGKWKLLGIGIYGPGCESPSRFLDYGMYHQWMTRVNAQIGRPAITRIAPNHLILRRTTTNVQRYGPCDPEESSVTIYSDRTTIVPPIIDSRDSDQITTVYYNVTLLQNVDYHCIILHVWNELNSPGTPSMKIRRRCTEPRPVCVKSTIREVHYYVEIKFRRICSFKVIAYGAEIKYEEHEYIDYYY